MKMRPPATPIITVDPYFSVWTEDSVMKNTIHWTGKPNTMLGRAFIDGEEYHFFGLKRKRQKFPPSMELENVEIDAFSTVITCKTEKVRLTVHFTSPLLPNDLYHASRPVTYCKVSAENLDGKEHSVKVRFTVSEELVLNSRGEGRALSFTPDVPGITAVAMGNGKQEPLWRSGDDVRIDWGYFYLGVSGEAASGNVLLDDMYAVYVEKEIKDAALFFFAYDDIYSIRYFGQNLKAYWKKDGKTIEQAIVEANEEYDDLLAKCREFSDKLRSDAVAKGGEKYAELLLLAVRQVMAAHKLVVDTEGNNLFISKECLSNGCAATVDVTYPSAPMFLLYNTELLKGMLRPIMKYNASEEWTYDFAPHDVGQYPLLNGQAYGFSRNPDGSVRHIREDEHMSVEECGNMIILFSAICDADDNTDFVAPHLETIDLWSKYLIKFGLDPDTQLCTDDFAGHLAHNVNLAVKAIMGIVAYSRILTRFGNTVKAEELMRTAREYAAALIERAKNSDGSCRLAYDKPETFSLKYNAVWDKLWGTEIFPESFYENEMARYKKELLPYGVPLDSREKYTKSDWLVWAATLTGKREDFELLTGSLWSAYNTMRTYVPMTDWYYCDTSHMRGFRNRTVQGGLFIKLMFD